jgi:hypothetical protein
MHKKFVFVLRMHYELIDLISLELFLTNLEEVISIEVALADVNIPDTYVTTRVTNKETTI